jgi:hypothetical protein
MESLLAVYATTGVFAAVIQIAYLAVAFVVGGMLTARGRRSGEWTQWVLGLHLILSMGVGFLLTCAGTVSVEFGVPLPRTALFWILTIGYAASSAGLTLTLHFTRRVFRHGQHWAFALAFVAGALMWTGWLGFVVSGRVADGRFEGFWFWLMTSGMGVTNLWVAVEPLVYYAQLRKRVRLGLTEPLVAERVMLWGIGSVARASMVFAGPLSASYLATLGEAERLSAGAAVLMGSSLMGLVTSVSYWLAFQPPQAYLRWVEKRAMRRAAA